MRRTSQITIASLLALAAFSGSALAGPLNPPAGLVTSTMKTMTEVEPRIAINAINTPGTATGLFRISQPGSYYLTGNITGVMGRHGIEIAASGVTVDLNGFDLFGGAGTLDGVSVTSVGMVNITIRNGSIRSWGSDGIDAASVPVVGCRIDGVSASLNNGAGILAGSGATVSNCTAYDNATHGIAVLAGSAITACASRDNNLNGFTIGAGSTMTASTANSNGAAGVVTSDGVVVQNCLAESNATNGIEVTFGCTITACTARANVLNGIKGLFQCLISGNACSANGSGGDGAGILVTGTDNRIEGNNCSGADRGIDVDAGGNFIVRNTCRNNTINWTLGVNNVHGPIIDRSAPASAAVSGNAAPSALGSTDPNANFTY